MMNHKAVREWSEQSKAEAYNVLTKAGCATVRATYWLDDGDRTYLDEDLLTGIEVILDEYAVYDLVYGDASIADYIDNFEEKMQESIDAYNAHFEKLAERMGESRDNWAYLATVYLHLEVDGNTALCDIWHV